MTEFLYFFQQFPTDINEIIFLANNLQAKIKKETRFWRSLIECALFFVHLYGYHCMEIIKILGISSIVLLFSLFI